MRPGFVRRLQGDLISGFPRLDQDFLNRVAEALIADLDTLQRSGKGSKATITLRVHVHSWLAVEMRRAREAAGLTQEQAARAIDISVISIHRKESDRSRFEPEEVYSLCRDVYGVGDPLHSELVRAAREQKRESRRKR